MYKSYNNIYKINKDRDFYNYKITACKNEIYDNITKRIDARISNLKKLGYEYNFNKNNIRISEKCLRKFIDIVNFYKYPTGIGLDENGYFTLDLKNKNYFISFSFQNKLHLCIYNFQKEFITKIIKPEDFFKNVDSNIYYDFFDKKNDFIATDNNFIMISSNHTLKSKSNFFYNKLSILDFKESNKVVKSEDFFKNVDSNIYYDFFDEKKYFKIKSDNNFIKNNLEIILPKNYKGKFFIDYTYEFIHW